MSNRAPATAMIEPERDEVPMPKYYRTSDGQVFDATPLLHAYRVKFALVPLSKAEEKAEDAARIKEAELAKEWQLEQASGAELSGELLMKQIQSQQAIIEKLSQQVEALSEKK